MIIFLYGPDDYRRSEKKRSIIAEFSKKRSEIGLGVFDLEEKNSARDLGGFLRTQSIFETAKLAVLENAFELDAPKLAKLLKPFVEEKNITILIAEKDKPVKALAFLLEKPAISRKNSRRSPARNGRRSYAAEAKKNDVKLTPAAAQFLGTIYDGNTWGLITEIEKLRGFKNGGVA